MFTCCKDRSFPRQDGAEKLFSSIFKEPTRITLLATSP